MQSAKRIITKACPVILRKPAKKIVYKYKEIRGRLDMILFPKKMKYFCPCCGTKSNAFIAGSYVYYPAKFNLARYENTKQDVLCPVCRSLPRHRILASWCENHIEMLQSSSILYFAPERCMTVWMKRNGVIVTTADLYKDTDLRVDIQATGLPNESYDMIICNHVLEHVDDFRVALKEIYRILRTGGSFICSFPMDPTIEFLDEDPKIATQEDRIRRFGQLDHKRVFGMKAGQYLVDAGFAVEEIRGEDYPDSILPVVGPADYDMNILFHCVKKEWGHSRERGED